MHFDGMIDHSDHSGAQCGALCSTRFLNQVQGKGEEKSVLIEKSIYLIFFLFQFCWSCLSQHRFIWFNRLVLDIWISKLNWSKKLIYIILYFDRFKFVPKKKKPIAHTKVLHQILDLSSNSYKCKKLFFFFLLISHIYVIIKCMKGVFIFF